ncbi:hypothetical protein K426_27350 (plasmid) [Sphingobium sp. TKS]|nr:hypothetical protein K426_27350 [Sphingobium sp. TKS]
MLLPRRRRSQRSGGGKAGARHQQFASLDHHAPSIGYPLRGVPHPAASAVAGDPSDAARAFSRAIRVSSQGQ